MTISKEEVLYVANLARLSVSADMADKLTGEMESIISFADMLSAAAIAAAPAFSGELRPQNVFREDAVTNGDQRAAMLANAPHSEAGCYAVPKILE
jgi:aspartyl-tRNA(Asn)/glutamyl-tRNA(Gln) amidotransferase subunit C